MTEQADTADAETPGGEEATQATTAMLKAFTHPLRRQILRLLGKREYLRAADAAEALGVPANKVSFHLRVLADAGLLVEAPERARDRRDRVWKGQAAAVKLGGPEAPIDDPALGDAVLAALIDDHYDLVRRMVAWTPDYMAGRTTEMHAEFSQKTLRLTEAEFVALIDRFDEIAREAKEAHDLAHPDRDDPESRIWNIDIIAADDTI
ncbi:DNA-binding transcriptional ArsR family regulator [Microbacterium sp. W4I4]|uniref:winged helix-turn-helix domain-containing protein n=1 Tax=Microbacterium sp. W4I4 TaxID=3042295 RepID=UPI00278832F1|nr:helix-turn-helix domain-containing protein [Microbacterium sp. W4I4]MDQ0614539.1 DNA-binding transcriptional ArsR family regulator [Microbacterium sp. W4I4]